jgi:hypothetical protein
MMMSAAMEVTTTAAEVQSDGRSRAIVATVIIGDITTVPAVQVPMMAPAPTVAIVDLLDGRIFVRCCL